ncbi:Oxoglutarate/iron-dependent dioxygenase [Corchorus capsularis]|uniref:Oxoglutarate/iron-dependent dioxygenase n=1 Tax=Corchorus capsularis TaxID=210143 RepID=A0A1R3I5E3_COCAP|nr:Oxoglutarate/iron-dependent dioxygenase [Corchorus capsularis]
MPMAAGPASPRERAQAVGPALVPMMQAVPAVADVLAKDTIISWFRGEFAAANAIIDALCGHLAQLHGGAGGSEYEAVFAAIHRRRLNWIPVLQMQKYHSIADVAVELKKVAANNCGGGIRGDKDELKGGIGGEGVRFDDEKQKENEKVAEKVMENEGNGEVAREEEEEDSPDSDITDSGSQEVQHVEENIDICSNHEQCDARASEIKLTKGFSAKEHVKGHMVNVVKGLKLYENVFTDSELANLSDFVSELRAAGLNGELTGDTFILFNKQIKGNKRELVQFGVPIFGHIKEEPAINIEPIPALLQSVIEHLIQWQLIPEYKKPNGCIINFFDEGEYSQPFLKPPHLEQPISTLLLSESSMAFGRTVVSDGEGNYRGPLQLSLKTGSLLVMRGNSADMARHVMCQSDSKRVSITFFRVRPETNQGQSPPTTPQAGAMTLWQPGVPGPYGMSNGALNGYEAMDMMPKWGVLHGPVVMLAPVRPVVVSPKKLPRGGTGVFLPWTMGSRKPAKHLPPRAQKGRMLALPPVESHAPESTSEPSITVEGKSV